MSESTSTKYEPHVMMDIVDPVKDGRSAGWKLCLYAMLFIEVIFVFSLTWIAYKDVLVFSQVTGEYSIHWKSVFKCLFIAISFVVIPVFWKNVAGTQKTLDYTLEHARFRIRIYKGNESFSKYGTSNELNGNILKRVIAAILRCILRKFHFYSNPRDVIISFTGIKSFDRDTGLTTENMNESSWVLEHPYQGDHGFNLLAVPKIADTDEVIIANFLESVNTIGPDHLVSTTMISGHNTSYIMDDVEEQLKLPNLSPVREKALWSIYNKFKNRVGTEEPLFIIHIGLPPAVHEYEHIENMRKVRDEFELTLNEIGIDTVLIKDPEDLAYIMNGMFTGNLVMGKDINEY